MSQNIILRIASCQELNEVIKYHPRGHGYVGVHGELKRNLADKSLGDPNTASGWSPRAHFMESNSHTLVAQSLSIPFFNVLAVAAVEKNIFWGKIFIILCFRIPSNS